MPLTDTAIRNAKPSAKPTKLFDEHGLFLIVTPTGGNFLASGRQWFRCGKGQGTSLPCR